MDAETVQPGQWLRFPNHNPSSLWRYLEEIVEDPFGRPGMVVLKFSNGDGLRLHAKNLHLETVNEITGRLQNLWGVSEDCPQEGVAVGRTTSQWMALGRLESLTERSAGNQRWLEAQLDGGQFGRHLVEIPAEARDFLGDALTVGVEVKVITPALSSGVPGITEVHTPSKAWESADGVPVTLGFLETHSLIDKAGEDCAIVANVKV